MPISELSHQTGLAMTTLTSMLDRMEAAGLVRRDRDSKDRRKVRIVLTDEARELQHDFDEVSQEMNAIHYEGFSDDEITQFEDYLRRVLTNIERRLQRP